MRGCRCPWLDELSLRRHLPDQLLIALRSGESQTEPPARCRNRIATVALLSRESDAEGAAPGGRVREIGELDGAGTFDGLNAGGRGLVALVVDQPDDPGGVLGGEIVPLVLLRVEREIEAVLVLELGERTLQERAPLFDREPVVF